MFKIKELNLVELLKDAPKGTRLYTPLLGECKLAEISGNTIYVVANIRGEEYHEGFSDDGRYYNDFGECLLFPSKDNRDWSTFKVEKEGPKVGDYIKEKDSDNVFKIKEQDKDFVTLTSILADSLELERTISTTILDRYEKVSKFNPKWLKPFDRVLVRDAKINKWSAIFFSFYYEDPDFPYVCLETSYHYCIPYNKETKHLIGTIEDEPEFYKI